MAKINSTLIILMVLTGCAPLSEQDAAYREYKSDNRIGQIHDDMGACERNGGSIIKRKRVRTEHDWRCVNGRQMRDAIRGMMQ